ncbi:MAG: hypothetical protein ACLGHN_11945 [Bacteriovoracia bacterium]
MAVVGDNLTKMSNCDSLYKPVALAQDIRIRFNLEFLKGCSFHCPGCYVNRDNAYSDKDLDIVFSSFQQFKKAGFVFDEIILGPTDFFAAYNTEQLLLNPKFIRFFKDSEDPIVLTLLTTLQSDEKEIIKRIELLNKNLGKNLELEILIPFQVSKILSKDAEYVSKLKERIQLLQRFECDVEYAMQMNIQETKHLEGFNLKEVSDYIWNEFQTITEFNPSFLRSTNEGITGRTIESWNQMLRENIKAHDTFGDERITFTMANPNHAGFNEITYNYHNGFFYSCPFIYENVFDRDEHFKIPPSGGEGFYTLADFMNHRDKTDQNQLEYLRKTKECENCPHSMSCVSKQVIDYMNYKGRTECILAKEVLDLYVEKF